MALKEFNTLSKFNKQKYPFALKISELKLVNYVVLRLQHIQTSQPRK